MTRGRRIALIALAVAAAAIAFVIARPGGDDDETDANPATTQQATGTTIPEQTVATTEEARTETEPATTEAPPPEPAPVTVRTRDARPVDGIQELTVTKGETVRLVVTSNVPEEVHVHGYDLSKDVGPGKPARFRFRADLEGIFEIELEEAGEPIVELRVEP